MKNGHGNIVTIWTASTGQALALPDGAASLSEEETAHARRLKQPSDQDRFLAARTLLRHALSEALVETPGPQIAPAQWRYRVGPNGKPVMAPDLPQLEFNLSHAGHCVAVGVGNSGPVGVDIERAVPDDPLELVNEALSDREGEVLRQLPDDRKGAAFIQFWTIKEACAKALGLGVTLDFRKLEVALDPPRVLNPRGLLDPGKTFAIENRLIFLDRCPYCLSVAAITEGSDEISFCFEPLSGVLSKNAGPRENQVIGWK